MLGEIFDSCLLINIIVQLALQIQPHYIHSLRFWVNHNRTTSGERTSCIKWVHELMTRRQLIHVFHGVIQRNFRGCIWAILFLIITCCNAGSVLIVVVKIVDIVCLVAGWSIYLLFALNHEIVGIHLKKLTLIPMTIVLLGRHFVSSILHFNHFNLFIANFLILCY